MPDGNAGSAFLLYAQFEIRSKMSVRQIGCSKRGDRCLGPSHMRSLLWYRKEAFTTVRDQGVGNRTHRRNAPCVC